MSSNAALRRAAACLLLPLSLSLASGCRLFNKSSDIVVPEMDTAREQADVARRQFARASQTVDEDLRKKEMAEAVKAFDSVVERFPDDKTFTPAARLLKADILYDQRDYRRAEAEYRSVVASYPDIADVHAGALFGLGQSLDQQERFRESKESFRQLIDQYQGSQQASTKDRVRRARLRYEDIRSPGDNDFFTRTTEENSRRR